MKDAATTDISYHGRFIRSLPLSDVRFIINKFETVSSRNRIARKSHPLQSGEIIVRSQPQKPAQSFTDCCVRCRGRGSVLNACSCDTEVFDVDLHNRGNIVSTAAVYVNEFGNSSVRFTHRNTNARGEKLCVSNLDEYAGCNVNSTVPDRMIDKERAACIELLDQSVYKGVNAFGEPSAPCIDNRRTDANVKSVDWHQHIRDSDYIYSVCLPGYLGGGFPFDVLKSSAREAALGKIPDLPLWRLGTVVLTACLIAPRMFTYVLLYPFCRLVFGTLYPAYASYKAVRSKNVKEYVKWMMYWIVFALFTCAETFTDVLFSWFPFYYEVKIVLVLWLLSPATKGSSILYRKFVHPALSKREQEIDEYLTKATEQGYHTVLNLGSKGVNYATTVIVQTAIKNLSSPNFAIQENRANTRGLQPTSQTDGIPPSDSYQDLQINYYNNNEERITPKIVEIEVDSESDPDYYPDMDDVPLLDSSARSRGIVRKRNVKKSTKNDIDGVEIVRTTRSRTAKEKRKQSVE